MEWHSNEINQLPFPHLSSMVKSKEPNYSKHFQACIINCASSKAEKLPWIIQITNDYIFMQTTMLDSKSTPIKPTMNGKPRVLKVQMSSSNIQHTQTQYQKMLERLIGRSRFKNY